MYRFTWFSSINDLDYSELTVLSSTVSSPFLHPSWLRSFENSGSIGPDTGWYPQHLGVFDFEDKLVAFAPFYIKTHNQGDFSWDWQWADIAERAGIPYQPKFQGCIPATPFGRYSFLVSPMVSFQDMVISIIQEAMNQAIKLKCASFNIIFPDQALEELVTSNKTSLGPLKRLHEGLQLDISSFKNFTDYLAIFDKNQRKNIKKERQSIIDQGITIKTLDLNDTSISKDRRGELAMIMQKFYTKTCDEHGPWAARFLNTGFFDQLFQYPETGIVLFLAYLDVADEPIAASFTVHKGPFLFGRYWGSTHFVPNLHFELCYYQPIEWGIARGLRLFDPGIGGDHKGRRGFIALEQGSFHHWFNHRFNEFYQKNLSTVNTYVQESIKAANEHVPIKTVTQ